jgi:hypothetical protein
LLPIDATVYLKGKPKYVNVYKPKPTPQPASKPTTVYHMPIYSPTYEYMSMDPMGAAMYSSPMMYGGGGGQQQPQQQQQQQHQQQQQSTGGASSYGASGYGASYGSPYGSNYKSSVNTDGDSTSSVASASHSGVDYDDDSGNYYVGKRNGRRNKLWPADYAYNFGLHRNDQNNNYRDNDDNDSGLSESDLPLQQDDLAVSSSNIEEEEVDMASVPNDDESYDHENDSSLHSRVKRQVYYESGYDGHTNCEGFPLEINVRSRIKLDRIFPIHGKSQIKKCIKPK